jgi:hypothetical protein
MSYELNNLEQYHPVETSNQLAALVCKQMRAVFRAHRRALKNNVEYCERKRDPPPNADGSGGGSATEDDDEM